MNSLPKIKDQEDIKKKSMENFHISSPMKQK